MWASLSIADFRLVACSPALCRGQCLPLQNGPAGFGMQLCHLGRTESCCLQGRRGQRSELVSCTCRSQALHTEPVGLHCYQSPSVATAHRQGPHVLDEAMHPATQQHAGTRHAVMNSPQGG